MADGDVSEGEEKKGREREKGTETTVHEAHVTRHTREDDDEEEDEAVTLCTAAHAAAAVTLQSSLLCLGNRVWSQDRVSADCRRVARQISLFRCSFSLCV